VIVASGFKSQSSGHSNNGIGILVLSTPWLIWYIESNSMSHPPIYMYIQMQLEYHISCYKTIAWLLHRHHLLTKSSPCPNILNIFFFQFTTMETKRLSCCCCCCCYHYGNQHASFKEVYSSILSLLWHPSFSFVFNL
jgi:hypothetical protein